MPGRNVADDHSPGCDEERSRDDGRYARSGTVLDRATLDAVRILGPDTLTHLEPMPTGTGTP